MEFEPCASLHRIYRFHGLFFNRKYWYSRFVFSEVWYIYIYIYIYCIENRVTVDNFIPFIFLFALLPLNKSGRILMSINGIQSNVSLTYQQTCYFFRNLNQEYYLDENVNHWLKSHHNDDNLHLKDVMKIVENSFILCDILYHFQSKIVKIIIDPKCYSEILHRKIYFDTVYDKDKMKSTPKERICSKLYRVLILHKPPPYLTNYRLIDTDYNELLAHIQIIIRNMFGYSKRPGQMSEYSFQSERSNSNYSKFLKTTSSSTLATSSEKAYSYVGKKNTLFGKQNSVIPASVLSLDIPPS